MVSRWGPSSLSTAADCLDANYIPTVSEVDVVISHELYPKIKISETVLQVMGVYTSNLRA